MLHCSIYFICWYASNVWLINLLPESDVLLRSWQTDLLSFEYVSMATFHLLASTHFSKYSITDNAVNHLIVSHVRITVVKRKIQFWSVLFHSYMNWISWMYHTGIHFKYYIHYLFTDMVHFNILSYIDPEPTNIETHPKSIRQSSGHDRLGILYLFNPFFIIFTWNCWQHWIRIAGLHCRIGCDICLPAFL